ncbi:uncharacterized protein EI97DRAFT_456389 [Westerdykella ornata]|uniref:Uncharacterized protein n=1 Tax=Westerdykella ornata TaxID=318751 RepID=A0A6A6JQZ9_WESOR|nr:uncharacterized protein EI97DRAFT_456389 [Westerdykella ornata]KAF2278972.1 hypothetical protein EI97DRAFT_456389 [Westerdykella ornata]
MSFEPPYAHADGAFSSLISNCSVDPAWEALVECSLPNRTGLLGHDESSTSFNEDYASSSSSFADDDALLSEFVHWPQSRSPSPSSNDPPTEHENKDVPTDNHTIQNVDITKLKELCDAPAQFGSLPANPIPIDDDDGVIPALNPPSTTGEARMVTEETRNQSTTDNEKKKDGQSSICSPRMNGRKNKGKRKVADMTPWGDPEFERGVENRLTMVWEKLEPIWEGIQDIMCKVAEKTSEPTFNSSCKRLSYAVQNAYDNLDIDTASELLESWKQAEVFLRLLVLYVDELDENHVTQFNDCVRELQYQAEICDALRTPPYIGRRKNGKKRRVNSKH